MSTKSFVWFGMTVGTTVGSFIPSLWGSSFLSFSSIIWSAVGGIAGIYLGFKIANY